MSVPNPVRIFRMVHWENVEYILQYGLYCRDHEKADPNYINIGHRQLIADRHDYEIYVNEVPKGNLGEYIPFYFAGHSPMLYLIINGYQGVEKTPQEDIVFLVSSHDRVKDKKLGFLFTDRNAKLSFASFYEHEDDFDKLDWSIIEKKYWNESPLTKDLKQAEYLVKHEMPIDCITHLVVKTEERRNHFKLLIERLDLSIQVLIDTKSKLFY